MDPKERTTSQKRATDPSISDDVMDGDVVPYAPKQVRPGALVEHPRVAQLATGRLDSTALGEAARPADESAPLFHRIYPEQPGDRRDEAGKPSRQERLVQAALRRAAEIARRLCEEQWMAEGPEDENPTPPLKQAHGTARDRGTGAERAPQEVEELAAAVDAFVADAVSRRVPLRAGDVVRVERTAGVERRAAVAKVTARFVHPLTGVAGRVAAHPVEAGLTRSDLTDSEAIIHVRWIAEGWYLDEAGKPTGLRASLDDHGEVAVVMRADEPRKVRMARAAPAEPAAAREPYPEPEVTLLRRLFTERLVTLATGHAPVRPGDLVVAVEDGREAHGLVTSAAVFLEPERENRRENPGWAGPPGETEVHDLPYRPGSWRVRYRYEAADSAATPASRKIVGEDTSVRLASASHPGAGEEVVAGALAPMAEGLPYWDGSPTTHPAGMRVTGGAALPARVRRVRPGARLQGRGVPFDAGTHREERGPYHEALVRMMDARDTLEAAVRRAIREAAAGPATAQQASGAAAGLGSAVTAHVFRRRVAAWENAGGTSTGPSLEPIPPAQAFGLPLSLQEVGATLSVEPPRAAAGLERPEKPCPARRIRFWFELSAQGREAALTVWADDPAVPAEPALHALAQALLRATSEGEVARALRDYEEAVSEAVRAHAERACPLKAGDHVFLPAWGMRGTVRAVRGDFIPAMSPPLWWWAELEIPEGSARRAVREALGARVEERPYNLFEGEPYEIIDEAWEERRRCIEVLRRAAQNPELVSGGIGKSDGDMPGDDPFEAGLLERARRLLAVGVLPGDEFIFFSGGYRERYQVASVESDAVQGHRVRCEARGDESGAAPTGSGPEEAGPPTIELFEADLRSGRAVVVRRSDALPSPVARAVEVARAFS